MYIINIEGNNVISNNSSKNDNNSQCNEIWVMCINESNEYNEVSMNEKIISKWLM